MFAQTAWADLDPDKQTVFITGSNRGMGLEFVNQFSDRGWNVIATARKPEAADALNALAATNSNIVIEQLDVTDFDRIAALAEKYKDQPFDILLSNAGITPKYKTAFSRADKIDYDMARRSYEVNALAPLKLSTTFMPNIMAAEDGKIVIITSKGLDSGRSKAQAITIAKHPYMLIGHF
jgi:NAD(P)-dependent dehydrogenase (short-subunit alcohol dehydrogenase family)